MTEEEIQDAITAEYDGTADTPASDDDDYLTRRRLINKLIRAWENDLGYEWDELWAKSDDQIVSSGVSTYSAPDDFRRAGGYVDMYTSDGIRARRYQVFKPGQVQTMDDSSWYAYFTGNRSDGYTLNINPVPDSASDGYTIRYDYYKQATQVAAPADVVEMSDPGYVINGVVAQLHKADGNVTGYDTSTEDAQDALKGMEIRQMQEAEYQSVGVEDDMPGFGV